MANDSDDRWALRAADRALFGNKRGATRLGFAVLLKLFQAEGRFPRRPEDVPLAAVEVIAAQVGVPAVAWCGYAWQGRTIEYHCTQIRAALGFREVTLGDTEALGQRLDGRALAQADLHRLCFRAADLAYELRSRFAEGAKHQLERPQFGQRGSRFGRQHQRPAKRCGQEGEIQPGLLPWKPGPR